MNAAQMYSSDHCKLILTQLVDDVSAGKGVNQMKKLYIAIVAASVLSAPAFAVGTCKKPVEPSIPTDSAQLSQDQFQRVRAAGDAYLRSAKSYLGCLDAIIYSTDPNDPIVTAAGKAHEAFSAEWSQTWGTLNLACHEWQYAHGTSFPGGCEPVNPSL
jgi:hypothetical protein